MLYVGHLGSCNLLSIFKVYVPGEMDNCFREQYSFLFLTFDMMIYNITKNFDQ